MNEKLGRQLFVTGVLLLILMTAVHSVSLFQKPMIRNESERQLAELMSNYKFTIMGSARTMNDFLHGFSISFGLASLAIGVFDLALRRERAALLKRAALVNVLWLAVMTGVAWHYFFAVPASFLTMTLVTFALAWVNLPSAESSPA